MLTWPWKNRLLWRLSQADLKLARLLAGLNGRRHKREVSALVTAMVDAGHSLSHPADHLATVLEAAQVPHSQHWARDTHLAFELGAYSRH